MTWTDCSKWCQGVCPCPNPPWLWKCNQVIDESKQVDPQMRFNFIGVTKIAKCGYALKGQYPSKS